MQAVVLRLGGGMVANLRLFLCHVSITRGTIGKSFVCGLALAGHAHLLLVS